MAFLAYTKHVLVMIYHWRELETLFDGLMSPRDPLALEVGDYVKKVSGDYHVNGYITSVFHTHFTRKPLMVVEIKADGGGSFSHIYSPSNLQLIEKGPNTIEGIRIRAIAQAAEARIARGLSLAEI